MKIPHDELEVIGYDVPAITASAVMLAVGFASFIAALPLTWRFMKTFFICLAILWIASCVILATIQTYKAYRERISGRHYKRTGIHVVTRTLRR